MVSFEIKSKMITHPGKCIHLMLGLQKPTIFCNALDTTSPYCSTHIFAAFTSDPKTKKGFFFGLDQAEIPFC